jgi:hypothetical protein
MPKLHSVKYGVWWVGLMLSGESVATQPVWPPVMQGGRTVVLGTENGAASEIGVDDIMITK